MPYVENKYHVIGDKENRAVAGLSMGGGGATGYGLWHADKFASVYAMSALMSIPEEGAARFDNPDSKLAILTRAVIERSCIKRVTNADAGTIQALKSVRWFVDCGDDDFLLDRNIEFFQAMRKAGIPCQFRVETVDTIGNIGILLYICVCLLFQEHSVNNHCKNRHL